MAETSYKPYRSVRPPYLNDVVSLCDGVWTPSQVDGHSNYTFYFWERMLYERLLNVIEFDLPSEWSGATKDFFTVLMLAMGYCIVFKEPAFGLIFQPCSIRGQNLYYQPTNATVTNPNMPSSRDLKLGSDGELLKLTKDYRGIWSLISYYSFKLAQLDSGIDMSVINSKTPFMLGAKDKASADTLKAAFDQVQSGVPVSVVNLTALSDDPDSLVILDRQSIKNSYLGTELIENQLTLLRNFDREVGIPTIPERKKERLVTEETDIGKISSSARAVTWVDTFNSSAELVNKMFKTRIKARYRYENELVEMTGKGDDPDGESKIDDSGAV